MVIAWSQLTPTVQLWPDISASATPTPMIEPISVCELEAGRPRYHVPTFHTMAETSSAKIIAKPAPEPE